MTDDAEICSCSALRQAARHMTRLYDAALSPVGIGLNQYAILSRLKRFGPMRMGDLAGRLVMDRSTLGHLLRPLETRRVIAMHVGDRDRRSRMVGLTAEGDALWMRAHSLWENAEAGFAAAFGDQKALALRGVLKQVERITLAAHPS